MCLSRKQSIKPQVKKDNLVKELNGFECGLVPEEIVGVTQTNNQIMFLVKWFNTNKTDLIHSKLAKEKCPQIVIKFYQKHLNLNITD